MIKLVDLLKGIIHDPFTGEIYEGLIKTIDIDKATEIITKQFGNLPGIDIVNSDKEIKVGFEPQYVDDKISRYINYQSYDQNISKLLQLVNNLGYFPSVFSYEKYNKTKIEKYSNSKLRQIMDDIEPDFLVFNFEKKYDESIEVPKFVYHITDGKYLNKIKSIGLTPKTKSKLSSHPERIYVALDKEDALGLWKRMKMFIPKEKGILLTINTEGLNDTFYNDPNFQNKGVYTYNNISPQNIINIEPIKEQ
jgi:hypothetical protein